MYPKDDELLNNPIVNYAMKMMFNRVDVDTRNLFNLSLLIQAINHLTNNKAEIGR